jgi:hypothetical protein
VPKKRRKKGLDKRGSRLAGLEGLSLQSQRARNRAYEVLSLMRTEGKSLTAAISAAQTSRRTVDRYVRSALVEQQSGRSAAKPSDRFPRRIHWQMPNGKIEITVRSSRTASKVAEHQNAIRHFLRTGDTSRLDEFKGKTVQGRPYVTDPKDLIRLQHAGEVISEDLYAFTT